MIRQFQIGEQIGDYRILGFIGMGGMGEVYQGVHVKLNRLAAIKVLNRMSPNSMLIQRFFNEARVQSSIHHPNIATLYDFQETEDRLFIFMEYVDGESLEDMIARRAFAVEDAVKTFQSIVEAVAFIHRKGIIHRDIKSPNIKFTSAGVVKLLDFGIAKDAESQNLTKIGGIVGTPRYLSPEQFDGHSATEQSDIWALGVLFYEMLTGVEPFQGDSLVTLCGQIISAQFERPEILNPAVPPDVTQIVMRCLKVETADRYATADELLEDVRRIAAGERKQQTGGIFGFLRRGSASTNGNSGGAVSDPNPENSLTSQPAAASRRPKVAAVVSGSVVALLLFFSLVGIGIWAMNDRVAENPSANSAPVVTRTEKSPAVQKNEPAQATAEQNQTFHEVRIDTTESSVGIFRNGQQIGTTPFNLRGKSGEKIELILKREGYEDKYVQIDLASGKRVYTFSLKPKS